MTILIAAATLLSPQVTPQASPYFPLEAGHTWEYLISVTSSVVRVRQMQKSLPVQDYEGSPVMPLEIYLEGKIDTTGYYRVIDGFVCLVGLSGSTRLPQPAKVVPVAPKKGMRWSEEGQTVMLGMTTPLKSDSRVISDDDADVFGKKVSAVTIETKASIGEGDSALRITSTEVYALGIGLVSRRQESIPGKDTKRKTITISALVRHEKAGG
jgi:hypothetical protein